MFTGRPAREEKGEGGALQKPQPAPQLYIQKRNDIEVVRQESLQGREMLNAEAGVSAMLMGLVEGTGTRS